MTQNHMNLGEQFPLGSGASWIQVPGDPVCMAQLGDVWGLEGGPAGLQPQASCQGPTTKFQTQRTRRLGFQAKPDVFVKNSWP